MFFLARKKGAKKMNKIYPVIEVYKTREQPEEYSVVAVLDTHLAAEEAVSRLQKNGFDLSKCSIVGKENTSEERVCAYYTSGAKIASWGKMGAFWGGIWGLLQGAGFFLIPGIGPVLVGGSFVAAMIGALEGAVVVGGLSALGAGFYNMGIPADSIAGYEVAVRGDRFIVIVNGNATEVASAKNILKLFAKNDEQESA
jgi:uncharacterized membrane protein